MDDFNKIMTIDDVAKYLTVHRSTVGRIAKKGLIKSYRIGRRRIFQVKDVMNYLEKTISPEYKNQ